MTLLQPFEDTTELQWMRILPIDVARRSRRESLSSPL